MRSFGGTMKFIGLTTKYKVTKEKLQMGISVGMIALISCISIVTVKALIESREAKDKLEADARFNELISEEETSSETEAITEPSEGAVTETAATTAENTVPSSTGEVSGETTLETLETSASSATEATTVQETTAATTTQPTFAETSVVKLVYASSELNVRSGPGTSYDIVKTIEKGSGIDVIGVTENGWYHTYNGNYVAKDLCQDEPVKVSTPTPVPQQTTAATAATTAATTTAKPTQPQPANNGVKDGMTYYGSCKITFYGPQPLGDGSYSTSTATGTTCCEGVTCAADWSIFPSGTVIYIPNDPLGGDGYYTVEDKGSGVKGDHIDIYAEAGESYSTTTCEVYIVN